MSHIDHMQQGLEQALQRAHQADDREVAARVREDGRRLAFLLLGLIRLSRMHHSENDAFDAPAEELVSVLRSLMALLGPVNLVCVEDQVYVNDVRLRVRPNEQTSIESLSQELGRHEVGGLTFHRPLDTAGARELGQALAAVPTEEGDLRVLLASRISDIGDIELTGRYRFHVSGSHGASPHTYAESARRAVSVLRVTAAQLAASRMINPLPVRRVVIDLVDSIKQEPERAAAEPLRKRALPTPERHQLSVCSLSLLLGRAIRLPESALSDLGVAAMLHDIGYIDTSGRAEHTTAGARMLLRQRGFHEAKLRRILVMLDHHRPWKPAGEGGTPSRPPSLFSRILHIADDYDLLVTGRSEQLPPMAPSAALRSMWPGRGVGYDPDLLAIFVQLMGLYPPGCVLELSNGWWALSVSGGRDAERFGWPVVCLVRDPDGGARPTRELIDLFTVREHVRPRRVLDPATEGLDVAAMLDAAFDGIPPVPN